MLYKALKAQIQMTEVLVYIIAISASTESCWLLLVTYKHHKQNHNTQYHHYCRFHPAGESHVHKTLYAMPRKTSVEQAAKMGQLYDSVFPFRPSFSSFLAGNESTRLQNEQTGCVVCPFSVNASHPE